MMTAIVTPAPVIRETQLQTRSRMNFELGFFVFLLVMLCAVRSLETGSCSGAPDFSTSDSWDCVLELELGATQPFILRHYKCKC